MSSDGQTSTVLDFVSGRIVLKTLSGGGGGGGDIPASYVTQQQLAAYSYAGSSDVSTIVQGMGYVDVPTASQIASQATAGMGYVDSYGASSIADSIVYNAGFVTTYDLQNYNYVDSYMASQIASQTVAGAGYVDSSGVSSIVQGMGYVDVPTASQVASQAVVGMGYVDSYGVSSIADSVAMSCVDGVITGAGFVTAQDLQNYNYVDSYMASQIASQTVTGYGYVDSSGASSIADSVAMSCVDGVITGAGFITTNDLQYYSYVDSYTASQIASQATAGMGYVDYNSASSIADSVAVSCVDVLRNETMMSYVDSYTASQIADGQIYATAVMTINGLSPSQGGLDLWATHIYMNGERSDMVFEAIVALEDSLGDIGSVLDAINGEDI